MHAPASETPAKIQVWDLPVRICHWLLAGLLAISWWTAENGELQYHRYSGYGVLGLLVFRIYWGFAGSTTARFSHFLRSPVVALKYLASSFGSRTTTRSLGHNPAGGWSVLLMLLLLATQVALGLVAVDVDGLESGPLSHWVSFDTGRTCAQLHELVFNALQVMVALHMAAVLFYLWVRRENLLGPMITGTRSPHGIPHTPMYLGSGPRILLGMLLAGLTVWLVASGFPL